jgi:hypothetical protein
MKKVLMLFLMFSMPLSVYANTLGGGLPGYSSPGLGGGVPGHYGSQSYYSQSTDNYNRIKDNETFTDYQQPKQYTSPVTSQYNSNSNYSNGRSNYYSY